MTLHFYEPPAEQKAGGLDLAVRSLRGYLLAHGLLVEVNPPLPAGPQAVHFHGLWQPQFLKVSRQCRERRIPYVVSPHGMLEPWAWRHKYWKKLPYYYLLERNHLRSAGAVLATSDQEAANLSRFVARDKIVTIPLGLTDEHGPAYAEAREQLGWSADELVLLFLSRIHPKKGLHLLLRALCGIADELPAKWRLVIVGEGSEQYLSECRGSVQAHEAVSRHIEWKGAIWGETKWRYYQGADLFCLPSFSENFGIAVIEACQAGTRVLTTRHTPWGFLGNSGAAILVEPEIASLERGLASFLRRKPWSEADRAGLSHQMRALFSWQNVGPQYLAFYRQLISPGVLAGQRPSA
jgi:glycosyltransferase involved in cell wall biosynthesis